MTPERARIAAAIDEVLADVMAHGGYYDYGSFEPLIDRLAEVFRANAPDPRIARIEAYLDDRLAPLMYSRHPDEMLIVDALEPIREILG